jgi:hypothetical protein
MKRRTRNFSKRLCYILIGVGALMIFLSTTLATTTAELEICMIVGTIGCLMLMAGTVGLRRIEQRELREERAAARRRSLRLLLQQEEERHHASM